MYGRDARLPSREMIDFDDYRAKLTERMALAWDCARKQIKKAQKKQKYEHDQHAMDTGFHIGDRVFVYIPAAGQGEAYKFAKKLQGPYCIMAMHDNGVELKNNDKPRECH